MNIEIANRLQQMRKKNNLSQEELAAKIGVSRQAVSKWERAEASPDTDNLILLAKLYGVSLDELVKTAPSPESASAGFSLKKDDYGYADETVKEMRPENYTEEEIYPNRPAQDVETSNSIPQGSPFGADISEEEQQSSGNRDNMNDFTKALENAGRAIGDAINAAGQKIGEEIKKAENNSDTNANWDKKFEQDMKKFEKDMERFGESMDRMGKKIDRRVNEAFAEKNKHIHEAHEKHAKEPATLLDKLFPLIVTCLFFCTIPLNLAHPGWTLFLLIPLYYTSKEALKKRNPMIFCYPVFCVWLYCGIGGLFDVFLPFLSNTWYGFMWLIFLTIPLYYTAYPAIKKRNPLIFCYPVLCVMIYLGVGMLLSYFLALGGIWYAIAWFPIFITIPIYYIVISHYRKNKKA